MPSNHEKPTSWLTAFSHILKLEQTREYDDKAVAGGLDRFLSHWHTELTSLITFRSYLPEIFLTTYSALDKRQRQEWVVNWLEALNPTDTTLPEYQAVAYNDGPIAPSAPPITAESTSETSGHPKLTPQVSTRLNPDVPVDRLRGISAKISDRFEKLGVLSIRDLLYFFPRRHIDYSRITPISEIKPDQEITLHGVVWESRAVNMGSGGRLKSTEAIISDESGNMKITWFGQSFLVRTIKANSRIAVSGKATVYRGHIGLQSPDYDILNDYGTPLNTSRHVPVYPLTNGITLRNLRRFMWQCLNEWLQGITDHIPHEITQRCNLMPLSDAISQAHFPTDELSLTNSRRRLAFDELFTLQVAVLRRRAELQKTEASISITPDQSVLKSFEDSLSFPLTPAQKRCIDEIISDLSKGVAPMNRLLQGEVGSGKTIVTLTALIATITSGYQGSIMVPTEVLAEQHFQTIKNLFNDTVSDSKTKNILTIHLPSSDRPMQVALLTGSTRARAKSDIIDKLKSCEIDLVIGTHTLIESEIEIPNLGLAVMDEQHRFGVLQRSELKQKGSENPHSLIMSATPIPRTLSLTLYGDLDVSTIDTLPPGRQTIQTRWIGPDRRDIAYGFISKQIESGRQAFIIYPLIDESDSIEARSAIEDHKTLSQDIFPQCNVGLLHGRMSSKEKDKVMRAFRDKDIQILISTAVVEVGIDIPNATVMMIESADRFGLSQLHQFRGRVGRGEHKSYCILVSDDPSELAKERLSALENINDGFKLAEVDLELRGPGDFFGTRQSGLPDLKMAKLSDRDILESARREASSVLDEDPDLSLKKHLGIKDRVAAFLSRVTDEST